MTTAPHWFVHDEHVTAAEMNTLSAAMGEVEGLFPSYGAENWPAMHRTETGVWWPMARKHRYLFYASTGVLRDPTGTYDDVTLSENISGSYGVLDLDSLGWLLPGVSYEVTGVNACFEDVDPY